MIIHVGSTNSLQLVNWSNPLTRGLLAVGHANARFSIAPPSIVITRLGKGISGTSSMTTQAKLNQYPVRHGIANSTVFYYVYFTQSPAWNSQCLYYGDTSSEWPNDLGLKILSCKSYGQVNIYARDTGGTGRTATIDVVSGSISTQRAYKFSATVSDNLYVRGFNDNGDYVDYSTSLQGYSYNPPSISAEWPVVGATNNNSDNDPNTQVLLVLRWGRVLTDAEIKQVHQNPWQIFHVPSRIVIMQQGQVKFRKSLSLLGARIGTRQLTGV